MCLVVVVICLFRYRIDRSTEAEMGEELARRRSQPTPSLPISEGVVSHA
jgi:hypothetical protein